jgi:hypothetical protein
MKSILITLVATAFAVPLSAAEEASPEAQEAYQRKLFAHLDSNSDGKVTEREFAVAVLWEEFLRFDTNQDGKITKAEYVALEKSKDIWVELDPSGSGAVTFKDCFDSKTVIDDLRAEWKALTSKLRKGRGDVRHFTLDDLPDLTP